MIFVNFKTFEESSGEKGISLLNALGEASTETSIPIIPVVQPLDLAFFSGKTLLPLWAQHIDPITYGAHTGFILPEEVLRLEAKGTFLNHSEHPLSEEVLENSVSRAKEVNLKTLVFASDIKHLEYALSLSPDYVSYEPPELVGSTDVSVSSARPEIISEAADLCSKSGIPLIVGAGIHSRNDISVALKRGASGFAVATNIVKANNPKEAILNLIEGYKMGR